MLKAPGRCIARLLTYPVPGPPELYCSPGDRLAPKRVGGSVPLVTDRRVQCPRFIQYTCKRKSIAGGFSDRKKPRPFVRADPVEYLKNDPMGYLTWI
jgi:hypothetical protein